MWRWGRIHVFRVDNGSPFGDPSRKAFSILHLCLVAHGVHLKINPPRSPTRNAKVERNQGTTSRWSEAYKAEDYLDLQRKLDVAVMDQREHYPTRTCKHQTRAHTYPELFNNPQAFHSNDFELERVYRFLAKGKWIRRVTDRGRVSLFKEHYQLTAVNKGKRVVAKFNAQTVQWDFYDQNGKTLISLNSKGISEKNLKLGLKESQQNNVHNSMSEDSS